MADVHYQGFVPHRPPMPMVRSLSFNGLPTGNGGWQTTTSPLDIPGASPPRRPRRLPYLLSVSVPDNADAVLSRSLLEQCRLDSASDLSPRSSSLKQQSSWASKVFSEVASSGKASLSTCASSNVQEEATTTEAHSSIVGTDAKFTKKKSTEARPGLQASALSAALRGSIFRQEASKPGNRNERVRPPSRAAQQWHYGNVKFMNSGHDDPETVGMPQWQTTTDDNHPQPNQVSLIQGSSPATSDNSSTSSTRTGWDGSDVLSPGLISQAGYKEALLDRLMEHCYALLANHYTELKGDASTSSVPSSALSPQSGSGQAIEVPEQSSRGKSKRHSNDNESDASEGSDGEDGNRGLSSKRIKMEENMKRLACPFFKRNPQRYQEERSCVGPGWKTVHRLKEHLYRCHSLPIHCLRCHEIFANEESLQTHSLSETPCQRRRPEDDPGTVLEGIGLAQERQLRSRKRTNKAEEDKWRDAYKICFPDDISVPSPYYEIPALSESNTSASSSGLIQYEDFVRTELPRRVRMELDRRLEQEWIPIEERLRSQLSDMMRDIQLTLLDEFRRRGPGARTESLSASTPSTNQPDGTPQRRDATVDRASARQAMNGSSATISNIDGYVADPSFANASAEGHKAIELPANYANLQTDMPFLEAWDTSQSEHFIISRDGGFEDLNWSSNDSALGCFVPDIEDWARSWGNRA